MAKTFTITSTDVEKLSDKNPTPINDKNSQ